MAAMQTARHGFAALPAALLAGALALFLGAALSDAAYFRTYEIQWNNFASWLIAGALVFALVPLASALRNAASARRRAPGDVAHAGIVALAWIVGLLDALVHARDAWASMPTGLVYSWIAFALAFAATWMAFARLARRGAP